MGAIQLIRIFNILILPILNVIRNGVKFIIGDTPNDIVSVLKNELGDEHYNSTLQTFKSFVIDSIFMINSETEEERGKGQTVLLQDLNTGSESMLYRIYNNPIDSGALKNNSPIDKVGRNCLSKDHDKFRALLKHFLINDYQCDQKLVDATLTLDNLVIKNLKIYDLLLDYL